jgi:hypothetical protein
MRLNARIVLSFAMAYGGHDFSNWLRARLMAHYKLLDPTAVYLDTVASRLLPLPDDAEPITFRADKRYESVSHAIDPKSGKESGAFVIGAQRQDWNDNFRTALSQASTMVIVLTAYSHASKWCALEISQAEDENQRRLQTGKKPLRLVVLDLDVHSSGSIERIIPGTVVVEASRKIAYNEPLLWDRGTWKVSNSALLRLYKAIGSTV